MLGIKWQRRQHLNTVQILINQLENMHFCKPGIRLSTQFLHFDVSTGFVITEPSCREQTNVYQSSHQISFPRLKFDTINSVNKHVGRMSFSPNLENGSKCPNAQNIS